MGIHVALIDKSEIIHKMLLHCLYYHTVQAHRFNNLTEYLEKFNNEKPSLVFVDWDIKQENKALIYRAREHFHPTPFVLLYRHTAENELSVISKDQVPYRIKKPLNPKEVRDICAELIPELKDSVLHSFLKFPKSKEEKKQEPNKLTSSPTQKKTAENQTNAEGKTKSFIGNLMEKTGLFKMPSPEEIESAEEFPDSKEDSLSSNPPVGRGFRTATGLTSATPSSSSQNKSATPKTHSSSEKTSPPLNSKVVKTADTTLIDQKTSPDTKTRNQKGFLTTQTVAPVTQSPSKTSFDSQSKVMKTTRKAFNKENINIDEDTQNDLAPMAIKSSPDIGKKTGQQSFGKQDLLQVFNKYKDSLEFQKLMEKTLAEYAQDAVAGVLKEDSVKSILQKPLENFKESAQFKQLVEKEISQYIQKQLPLIIKLIVEKEIKKIIGD